MRVRTRFAPSPTNPKGDGLHIGGLRTALFSYAFAKKHGGDFILRVEDTDEERSNDACGKNVIKDLLWAGLKWDEGPSHDPEEYKKVQIGNSGPYFQSQRLEIYAQFEQKLLSKGLAYKQDGATWLRTPVKDIVVNDEILGRVEFPASVCKDRPIVKSSGMPVFHFAVVVDDATMGVSHVIRAQEHLQNTWFHILIQECLDLPSPKYAHVPLIFNQDGTKMSKRQAKGAINTADFIQAGYTRQAIINYLALLGWSPGDNKEEFDIDYIVSSFSLEGIGKSNAKFDYKKLEHFNKRYLSSLSPEGLAAIANCDISVAQMMAGKLSTLNDIKRAKSIIDGAEITNDAKTVIDQNKQILADFGNVLANTEWNKDSILATMKSFCTSSGKKMKELCHPVGVAISGSAIYPPIESMMLTIGRDKTLSRLRA